MRQRSVGQANLHPIDFAIAYEGALFADLASGLNQAAADGDFPTQHEGTSCGIDVDVSSGVISTVAIAAPSGG